MKDESNESNFLDLDSKYSSSDWPDSSGVLANSGHP
jgi:hypothetical protein